MKTALVYDWVDTVGGAERVLVALHELYPDAPLFTTIYQPHRAMWAHDFQINPSWLQQVPILGAMHELLPIVSQMAFESFSFDDYDVVISITSATAKAIITKPETLHICYCLTPTRYLWSGYDEYNREPGFGLWNPMVKPIYQTIASTLRSWDRIAAYRPDRYIAISETVKKRIQTYYHVPTDAVIYPPVDTDTFHPLNTTYDGEYFLCVSRFVPYKRLDLIVDAFNDMGLPLVLIGRGNQEQALRNRAKSNIQIITRYLTDKELALYYQKCRAFVYAGIEDFGISVVEALACGKPVVAYQSCGIGETVIASQTGVLFEKQSKEDIIHAVRQFDMGRFSSTTCRHHAELFSKKRFQEHMKTNISNWRNAI